MEHLSLLLKKDTELGRGTKEETQVPHFLDSERPFSSSRFNVSEIGMCLNSLYEF